MNEETVKYVKKVLDSHGLVLKGEIEAWSFSHSGNYWGTITIEFRTQEAEAVEFKPRLDPFRYPGELPDCPRCREPGCARCR